MEKSWDAEMMRLKSRIGAALQGDSNLQVDADKETITGAFEHGRNSVVCKQCSEFAIDEITFS